MQMIADDCRWLQMTALYENLPLCMQMTASLENLAFYDDCRWLQMAADDCTFRDECRWLQMTADDRRFTERELGIYK